MRKIYIYSTTNRLGHSTGCLLQGLIELNEFNLYCNIDYQENTVNSNGIFSPNIKLDRVTKSPHLNNEDILIIDETRELSQKFLLPEIQDFYRNVSSIAKSKSVVVFYMCDDANVTKFPDDIILYSAHLNSNANLNTNAKPLPFAISLDLILASNLTLLRRKPRNNKSIINNFNVTLNQTVRAMLDISLLPLLSNEFVIDSENLSGNKYVDKLSTSSAILAYGGSFYQNILTYGYLRDYYKDNKLVQMMNNFPSLGKRSAIFRWDSWRFWEALMFECPPFQLDFDQYGFVLPVLPNKWEHYIPIDLSSIISTCSQLNKRLASNPDFFEHLGYKGRKWAIDHYHPTIFAQRFIEDLDI
jgi:hypothetical protein